jgi:hypothetical protein
MLQTANMEKNVVVGAGITIAARNLIEMKEGKKI